MKKRLLLHVTATYEAMARHHIGWDPVLREELSYQGGGDWYSSGIYRVGYDDNALMCLKSFVDDRMEEYHIKEFYTEIEEYED